MNISELQKKHFMQCWGKQSEYNPIAVEKTEGCWIHTKDGRKIFDLRSAHECINLGFDNQDVIDAIKKQLDKVIYVTDDFATEPTALLAQKLAEITPGSSNKKVWFAQSGAGAVEAAIKAARFFKYHKSIEKQKSNEQQVFFNPYPYKIISRYRSWHGATSGAASVSGDPRRWFNEPNSQATAVFAPEAYCYQCPLKQQLPECELACAEYIDHMVEMEGGSEKVAAVILEPVVGSNGIIPPPENYFKRVREICDKWELLLIIDETMSGFGRTGKMLAIEHYGIEPDIIIMGKALGAYVPLTAAIFNEKVSSVFEENIFGHGQSYSGHALASTAALAGINTLLEKDVLNQVTEKGNYLGMRLKELQTKYPLIGDLRGLGLFWTIEIVKDPETRKPLKSAIEKYKKTIVTLMADYLLEEKNIYVPSDKFGIWIVPPLIVSYQEIDFLVEAIDDTLSFAEAEIMKQVKNEKN